MSSNWGVGEEIADYRHDCVKLIEINVCTLIVYVAETLVANPKLCLTNLAAHYWLFSSVIMSCLVHTEEAYSIWVFIKAPS